MNYYLVNGVEKTLASAEKQSLRELIQNIRNTYSTDTTLISSILVNGVEIDSEDEEMIGAVQISELRSLEVFTAHPKEIAEETLQSLIEFTKHLEDLCLQVSQDPTQLKKLPKLADGITTFIDAMTNVKQILRIGALSEVQVLEADLASILKDVLEYQQKREYGFLASVIRDALASNLALWRTEGLPNLIRSRDS
jgi:hypothetical protein